MKKIATSIINFNGNEDTIECVKSLNNIRQSGFEQHIIIVDNASKDPVEAKDFSFCKFKIHILKQHENLGFSGGHNKAIEYALKENFDYVLILNNDTFVEKNFLQELFDSMEEDSSIGIAVPKIYFAGGYEYHRERYKEDDRGRVIWYGGGIMDWKNVSGSHRWVDEVDNGGFDMRDQTDFATGCCMLLRSEDLDRCGGFDEKYFLYYEDVDLSERIKLLNKKIFFIPRAIIWHKNAKSAGGSGSPLQDYFIARNRMMLGFKFAGIRSKIALVRESIRLLIAGREWQKRGIMDFYLNRFGKGSFIK